jgi:DNA-binding NtrC family response regulator
MPLVSHFRGTRPDTLVNRILLIEDDPSAQHLYRTQLRELGHEVVVSSTGAMGVMEARTAPFDLFLVDVHLGEGIDGYEVCRRLKAIPGTHRVPVLMISGNATSQEDLHRGYEAGCQSFVVKGDATALEDVVRAMLHIKSLQDDLAEQNKILEDQNRRLQAERARAADLELALGSTHAATHFAGTMPRPEAVLLVDEDGIVRIADRGARELFGHGIEGRHLAQLAPHSRLEATVRDARTEPRESVRIEVTSRSGTRRSFLVGVFPLVSGTDHGESGKRVVLLAEGASRRASSSVVRRGIQGLVQAEWGPMLESLRDAYHPGAFVGASSFSHSLRVHLESWAANSAPILLQGPAGTGKEHATRILHHTSQRSRSHLILSCAGKPEIVAVDLFGDEQADAVGFLTLAQGGTLQLDELDQLPMARQERLAAALTGTVGSAGRAEERADVRLVATTSSTSSPEELRWKMHPDLYRLLEPEHIVFPPLVQRTDDIHPLAESFLARYARHPRTRIDLGALASLLGHAWSANVDGLRRAIRRACAAADGPLVRVEHLPKDVVEGQVRRFTPDEVAAALPSAAQQPVPGRPATRVSEPDGRDLLNHHEKLALLEALKRTAGDKLAAAQLLGVGKSTFYRKIKQHGIS